MMNIGKKMLWSSLAMTAWLSSCTGEEMKNMLAPLIKAPGASIERQVKGHEQIYAVQAILRLAKKSADGRTYVAYGLSQFVEPPVPLYQQIDLAKDAQGRMQISSQRKAFDVIKAQGYYYALELRYYDLNGKLINHQFSSYDQQDVDESTLLHHQHFFTLQNYSLTGQQLVYPMTLDSLYYDEFTFPLTAKGERQASSDISINNVYAQSDLAANAVKYEQHLAQIAIERTGKKILKEPYRWGSEQASYYAYKTYNPTQMDALVSRIFSYTYRDTDPVEEELYTRIRGTDDLGRERVNRPTQLLQQQRDLTTERRQDYLGFKGVLTFHRSHIAFQMRVSMAHLLTATEKYISPNGLRGVLHEHHQISPSWNSFDIDYPLAFRVIADADSEGFVRDVQRFYPKASAKDLQKMFSGASDWFRHIPRMTF